MHWPKCALAVGGLRRYRRCECLGMGFTEREIAESEFQFFSQFGLDTFNDRVGATAMGALVIAILHEFQRGVDVTLDMIFIGERGAKRMGHD